MPDQSTLDPDDWDEIQRVFQRAIESCLSHTRDVRERPVWQPTPETIKARFREPLPRVGQPLEKLLARFEETVLPYGTGNVHPRFWGWVHGSGNVAGALGEMLAGFMNCNAGGRDHVATYVERQVIDWSKEIFGFPATSSGILTTGTSMATLIALAVVRDSRADAPVQKLGVAAASPLVAYASAEAHRSVIKAFDLLGLGTDALRLVPVDGDSRLQVDRMAQMVTADRANGCQPFAVIATAGSANTGAIDDLDSITEFCRENDLWLHVDGAFGGLAVLAPEFRPQLAAIAQADSVAFDFHKWLHVPYDAGCVLVRDASAHRSAFAARPSYLAGHAEGLAAGDPWFCDFGPELSRGFRALKVWFSLKAYGAERYGELIARNCASSRAGGSHRVARGIGVAGEGLAQHRLLPICDGWAVE